MKFEYHNKYTIIGTTKSEFTSFLMLTQKHLEMHVIVKHHLSHMIHSQSWGCCPLPSHWNARRLNCRLPWLFKQAAWRISFSSIVYLSLWGYICAIKPLQFMMGRILTCKRSVNFRQVFLLAWSIHGSTTMVYWHRPNKCSCIPCISAEQCLNSRKWLVVGNDKTPSPPPILKVTFRVAGVIFAWHWELATHLHNNSSRTKRIKCKISN